MKSLFFLISFIVLRMVNAAEPFSFSYSKLTIDQSHVVLSLSFESEETLFVEGSMQDSLRPYYQLQDQLESTPITMLRQRQIRKIQIGYGLKESWTIEFLLPIVQVEGQRIFGEPKASQVAFFKVLKQTPFSFSTMRFEKTYIENARVQNSFSLFARESQIQLLVLQSLIVPLAPDPEAFSALSYLEDRSQLGLGLGLYLEQRLSNSLSWGVGVGELEEMPGQLKVNSESGESRLSYLSRKQREASISAKFQGSNGFYIGSSYKYKHRSQNKYKGHSFWLIPSDVAHVKESVRIALGLTSGKLKRGLGQFNEVGAEIAFIQTETKNPVLLGLENNSRAELQLEFVY